MEALKTLPIAANRMALGQLLTPTLVATASQAVAMAIVVVGLGGAGVAGWAFLAFLLPVNFLFYAVENLLFLWYPSRVVAGQFDVMAIGRQILFMLAKFLGLGLGLGLATGVGAGVYFLDGQRIVPALVVAWLVMLAAALALVPLVGQAFRKFDVSGTSRRESATIRRDPRELVISRPVPSRHSEYQRPATNPDASPPEPGYRMSMICRILPHRSDDGPANMALDEALLDSVAADPSMAVARTYEWSSPTLSLGYFQPIAEAEADPRWLDVPVVRRPTGGGALWHDLEVTYAVILPADHPAARPSRTLYATIHRAIADHLRSLGIPAGRRGEPSAVDRPGDRPFLCFNDRDAEDIVFRDVKIVGGAQRRRSGAVLQHGSLLLGRSRATPELPGLSDLAPVSLDPSAWGDVLREVIPRALGLNSRAEDVLPGEAQRTAELVARKYADRSWTRRR